MLIIQGFRALQRPKHSKKGYFEVGYAVEQ